MVHVEITYEEYKRMVLAKAKEIYPNHNICIDTIEESYQEGEAIEEAANEAVMTTQYWDGTLMNNLSDED